MTTSPSSPRRWAVIAAFFDTAEARWLDDFIDDRSVTFYKVPAPRRGESWHGGTRRRTGWRRWLDHLRHARTAFRTGPDGIVCAFPQLTMCAALLRKLSGAKPPIIGYNFNLGGFPNGPRGWFVRWVAQEVACFVVHSPTEVAPYARYLRVPEKRVVFVPLQRGEIGRERQEATEPYIIAMGSAGRDYPTLIRAVDALEYPTRIITRKADIADLPQSDLVSFHSDMSMGDCLKMLAGARLQVTPIRNLTTASGQITFLNAMQLGVANIVTDCPGTQGYIADGQNGRLVAPHSVEDMTTAIAELWSDDALRARLADQGQRDAARRFSDAAAAASLARLIHDVDPALPHTVETTNG